MGNEKRNIREFTMGMKSETNIIIIVGKYNI